MFPVLAAAVISAWPFEAALRQAEQRPAVAAASRGLSRRAELTAGVSGLTSNPTLQITPGLRVLPTTLGPELGAQVSMPFNLGGLGARRREAVGLELDVASLELVVVKRAARQAVAEAWLRAHTAELVHGLHARTALEAQGLFASIEKLASAGAVTSADLATARAWRAEAGLAVLDAEAERLEAGLALALALGEAQPIEPAVTEGDWPSPTVPSRLAPSPEARLAEVSANAEAARARELAAARATQLSVAVSAAREGQGEVVGLVGLGLQLPVFDQGQRERAAQAAAAEHAAGAAAQAQAHQSLENVRARHEIEHAEQLVALADREWLPALEQAATAQRRRLELGEGTAHDWVVARRALAAALAQRTRFIAARALAAFRLAERTPEGE